MSLIQQLTDYDSGDNTIPKLYRDSFINGGTKFLFDFLDSYCNANADGTLAAGAVFNNLVDGANGGIVVAGSTIANLTGKAGISLPGAGSGYIGLGNVGDYDFAVGNKEFLIGTWIKTPSSGYIATAYTPYLFSGIGTNANTSQWWLDNGSGGTAPRGIVGLGTGSTGDTGPVGFGLGAVTQLVLHCKPAQALYELYGNGALITTFSSSAITLQSGASQRPIIAAGYKGTMYRVWGEDLTASIAADSTVTAAGRVAADYSANSSRFT